MPDISLETITTDLPLREFERLTQVDLRRLLGLSERLENLEQMYGQLWTGVNHTGASANPWTGAERAMKRWRKDVMLGSAIADYTDWTPVLVGSGYTIWRISPTNYHYNVFNSLYMDGEPFRNTGLATSLVLASFSAVQTYDGASYTDHTTEAATEWGTDFEMLADTGDYLYVGAGAAFAGTSFNFHTAGLGLDIDVEYWDGSAWSTLTPASDTTEDWAQNGSLKWTAPSGWAQTAVNGTTAYWVRFSTADNPERAARAYYVAPPESVMSMLQMSREDLEDRNFAFSSLGSDLYVALPSEGEPQYEGASFIRSGSSSTNLQNFFTSKHQLWSFYEDSTWTGGDVNLARRRISAASEPVPQVDEEIKWYDSGNDKVYIIYNDPTKGSVKVELT